MPQGNYPAAPGNYPPLTEGNYPGASNLGTYPIGSRTPLTILGSLAWWVRADTGITVSTGVSAWAGMPGTSINLAQGTAGQQPAFVASAINGQPAVRADGVDDFLAATWARAAPGTQPFYIWIVMKQVTWTSGKCMIGDSSAGVGFTIQQLGTTPTIQPSINAVQANSNSAATVGSYFRHEAFFDNTAGTYYKIGATNVSGGIPANGAGGGSIQLFSLGDGTNTANNEIAEAFAFLGTPTGPQRTALDAYCTSRYGSGLV